MDDTTILVNVSNCKYAVVRRACRRLWGKSVHLENEDKDNRRDADLCWQDGACSADRLVCVVLRVPMLIHSSSASL